MKKRIIRIAAVIVLALTSQLSMAQTGNPNAKLAQKSTEVLDKMIKKTPSLQSYYNQSYGYAIFPKVTKGAMSIGGAGGKGVVYKNHEIVNAAKLRQLTVGFQFGGQQYSEVIFFQNEEAFEQFMNEKAKFNGQVSAVALKAGASADVSYSYGVAIFTQAIGGLMYEASIGVQCFLPTNQSASK